MQIAQQELFEVAVESSPTAIVMIDSAGDIVLVNAKTESMFGYPRDELLGRPVEILVPERFRQHHPQLRRTFFGEPVARSMGAGRDLFGVRQDGTEFPVEIGLNPVKTEEEMFVLAVVVDITERKQAEQELAGYAQKLKRSNADLEQFAYAASHDLQEPLRAISGYCQLLKMEYEGRLEEQMDEWLTSAIEGAQRMQTLITDLLMYSRIGRSNQAFQLVDCTAAVDTAARNLEVRIAETGAKITYDTLPTVPADMTQIVQLFQNLIGNALKFHGDKRPEIHIAAEQRAGTWLFSVRDNGIGIDPQYGERIFMIFQRLHNREQYGGTGIGLAVCKRIVERHGGMIWVEPNPDGGTIFHFTLSSSIWPDTTATAGDGKGWP